MEQIRAALVDLVNTLTALDSPDLSEDDLRMLSHEAQKLRIISEDLFVFIRSTKRYLYNSNHLNKI